jgi:hypothetical protein
MSQKSPDIAVIKRWLTMYKQSVMEQGVMSCRVSTIKPEHYATIALQETDRL